METIVAEAFVSLNESIDPAIVRELLDRQCNGVIKISVVERIIKSRLPAFRAGAFTSSPDWIISLFAGFLMNGQNTATMC